MSDPRGSNGCGLPVAWGSGTLVNGTCTVSGTTLGQNSPGLASRIILTRSNVNASSAIGTLCVPTSGRSTGLYGFASFSVQSLDSTGSVVSGDQSSFDYVIIG